MEQPDTWPDPFTQEELDYLAAWPELDAAIDALADLADDDEDAAE